MDFDKLLTPAFVRNRRPHLPLWEQPSAIFPSRHHLLGNLSGSSREKAANFLAHRRDHNRLAKDEIYGNEHENDAERTEVYRI